MQYNYESDMDSAYEGDGAALAPLKRPIPKNIPFSNDQTNGQISN